MSVLNRIGGAGNLFNGAKQPNAQEKIQGALAQANTAKQPGPITIKYKLPSGGTAILEIKNDSSPSTKKNITLTIYSESIYPYYKYQLEKESGILKLTSFIRVELSIHPDIPGGIGEKKLYQTDIEMLNNALDSMTKQTPRYKSVFDKIKSKNAPGDVFLDK